MLDINVTECSKGMYWFCFIFYLYIVLSFWNKYSKNTLPTKPNTSFRFLILLYIIFSFYNGDYWHYLEYVKHNDLSYEPSEQYYIIIKEFVNNNYILFRILVWGVALLLVRKAAENFNLNANYFLFFFFTIYISIFDYARVSLALSAYFYGLSLLIHHNKSKPIIGIILIISSVLFHNSVIPLILFTTLLLIPFNKKIIIILFILLPYLTAFINTVLLNFIGMDLANLEDITNKLNHYDKQESIEYSFLEKLRLLCVYLSFYIPFIGTTYIMYFKNKIELFPNYIVHVYKIMYLIILLATCCLFLQTDNNILFYRYLYMAMMPISFITIYLKQHQYLSNKYYRFLLFWGVFCLIFRHAKYLYVWPGPVH